MLRRARLADLIESLPDGLETVVGERGYRLSGGERQRLTIARLLLARPRVVILDEATAHLDSTSEAAVQAALGAALTGRTSLVIAHRLSTIRSADQILVIEDGRIVERGRHPDLLGRRRPLRRALPHPVRPARPRLDQLDFLVIGASTRAETPVSRKSAPQRTSTQLRVSADRAMASSTTALWTASASVVPYGLPSAIERRNRYASITFRSSYPSAIPAPGWNAA